MLWENGQLTIEVDEISALPLVSRVHGTITVTPTAVTNVELPLTEDGTHIWRPFAPSCDIKVDLEASGWQWEGHGYFDANFGTRALEQDFNSWTWGRYPTTNGAACFYDATRQDGSELACGIEFRHDGSADMMDLPPISPMKRSLWLVHRTTRGDAGYKAKQVLSMLDAPFYCRSAVKTQIHGEETVGVHEALDLRRYGSSLLKPMIAVRVPRRSNWTF